MATQKNDIFNPFKVAAESFEAIAKAGMTFQRDAVKMMTDAADGTVFEQARDRAQHFGDESIEMMRNTARQSQQVFEQSCKANLDMLRQCVESVNAGSDRGEQTVETARKLWRDTFETAQQNAETMAQTCTEAVENWSQNLTKVVTESAEPVAAS